MGVRGGSRDLTNPPIGGTGIRIVHERVPDVIGPLCRKVERPLLKEKPHELKMGVHKLQKNKVGGKGIDVTKWLTKKLKPR